MKSIKNFLRTICGCSVSQQEEILNQPVDEPIENILPPEEQSIPIAYIKIELCNDGAINIGFDWANYSANMANLYGEFLYHVNKGKLVNGIQSKLHLLLKQDITKKPFIDLILHSWKKQIHGTINNDPIIKKNKK